jgi:hypothetical protein
MNTKQEINERAIELAQDSGSRSRRIIAIGLFKNFPELLSQVDDPSIRSKVEAIVNAN